MCNERNYLLANKFVNPKQLKRNLEAFHKFTILLSNSRLNWKKKLLTKILVPVKHMFQLQ